MNDRPLLAIDVNSMPAKGDWAAPLEDRCPLTRGLIMAEPPFTDLVAQKLWETAIRFQVSLFHLVGKHWDTEVDNIELAYFSGSLAYFPIGDRWEQVPNATQVEITRALKKWATADGSGSHDTFLSMYVNTYGKLLNRALNGDSGALVTLWMVGHVLFCPDLKEEERSTGLTECAGVIATLVSHSASTLIPCLVKERSSPMKQLKSKLLGRIRG